MERRVERALLAKVGALLFAFVLLLPASISANAARPTQVFVAGLEGTAPAIGETTTFAFPAANVELPEIVGYARALVPAAFTSEIPAAFVSAAQSPVVLEPPATGGVVLASWYGPGFFGNRTACGMTYTAEIVGVAHRTLPCGTRVSITSPAGVTVVTQVIDRGPYVAGRALDLSAALRTALRCSDLCSVRMDVLP